jgi:hypothetical protein
LRARGYRIGAEVVAYITYKIIIIIIIITIIIIIVH